MKLIIQIPCLNEASTLTRVVEDLPREVDGFDRVEVLVIDDGSTDETSSLARNLGVDHVVRHARNRGLAAAFETGLCEAIALGADVIVNTDGDHQYPGRFIADLVRPIVDGHADVVVGDRRPHQDRRNGWLKRQCYRLGRCCLSRVASIDLPDAVSGFRAYSRTAAIRTHLTTNFSYTVESLLGAVEKGMAVRFVPIDVNEATRQSRLMRSIPRFCWASGMTALRVAFAYRPSRVFFPLGILLGVCGLYPISRFLYFYAIGLGDGHVQSLVLGASLLMMGWTVGLTSMIAELLRSQRRLSEKLLERHGGSSHARSVPPPRLIRSAMTMIELMVVLGIIAIAVAMLLPALGSAREAGRRIECVNRLRQVGLGLHNYHDTHRRLPPHGGGTSQPGGVRTVSPWWSNHGRLSFHVALLPFIEQQSLWEEIGHPVVANAVSPGPFPPMGPVPWWNELAMGVSTYPPWRRGPSLYRCPSDPGGDDSPGGATNYAACLGDGVAELGCAVGRPQWGGTFDDDPQRYDDATKRGMFAPGVAFRLADCLDGLSQTMLLGEIIVGDSSTRIESSVQLSVPGIVEDPKACVDQIDPARPRFYRTGWVDPRGSRWADSAATFTGFNAVLAPGGPSCSQVPQNGAHPNWFGGIFSAASRHPGGVHVAMTDGAVRFVTDSVQCHRPGAETSSVRSGNRSNPPASQSPYGVWGGGLDPVWS